MKADNPDNSQHRQLMVDIMKKLDGQFSKSGGPMGYIEMDPKLLDFLMGIMASVQTTGSAEPSEAAYGKEIAMRDVLAFLCAKMREIHTRGPEALAPARERIQGA